MATTDASTADERAVFIRWKRWLPFAVIGTVTVIVIAIDHRYKSAPFEVIAPKDASLVVYAVDVGAAWSGIIKTSTWSRISRDAPDPLFGPIVKLRKQLGIRISPQRWSAWLGPQAAIVRSERGWCIAAQPGILMRVATWVHGLRATALPGDTYNFRGWFYRWNGDQLHIATDPGELDTFGGEDGFTVMPPEARDAVRIVLPNYRDLSATMYAREGWPVNGTLSVDTVSAEGRKHFVQKRDERQGLIEISGVRPTDWSQFLQELLPDWPTTIQIRGVLEALEGVAMEDSAYSVWVLERLDEDPHFAVPIFTLASTNRGVNSLAEPEHVLREEYRAGSLVGWREPWLGYRYPRVTAADDEYRFLTNSPGAMRSNAGRWTTDEATPPDVRVVVRLPELLEASRFTTSKAAELNAVRGWDTQDVEELYATLHEHVKYLGRVELEGAVVDEGLVFEGYLDAPDE